ncbi:1-phosphofructokinase family hexose kinase [Rugosimonospora acidiphila]|uniref:1-phosphofructokinase family hexose kinase n=1 Tax=Rugosimonospora acidiphila TaxID=556531 RepID=A0ABP9SKC7_9ACTN
MILTVTLNAALDVTYQVPRLRPGEVHRVAGVHERPGGKGVNVARVLHGLNEPVLATGLVGGGTGAAIRTLLGEIRHSFVDIAGISRRTTVVVDGSSTTGFWEPGPEVSGPEWESFVAHYAALLRISRVVVLSGSLPPGLPVDAYARLIELARSVEVPVVLDASGEPLAAGVAAGPDIVKPNAHELAIMSGMAVGAFEAGAVELVEAEAVAAADAVRDGGRTAVVASLGPHGLVASTGDGRWHARPAAALTGNPTGAGDAAVAALAFGLAYRVPWPQRLADAVGLSGAAVLNPVAGTISQTDYARLRRAADVREV